MGSKRRVRYRKPPLTINVRAPKKRVLASMEVRLSPKDFRRRFFMRVGLPIDVPRFR